MNRHSVAYFAEGHAGPGRARGFYIVAHGRRKDEVVAGPLPSERQADDALRLLDREASR